MHHFALATFDIFLLTEDTGEDLVTHSAAASGPDELFVPFLVFFCLVLDGGEGALELRIFRAKLLDRRALEVVSDDI